MRRRFGPAINVELIGGSNGVFEISLDGRTIFSKKALGRFPEKNEIVALVEQAG